jgi:hypothetical protein
MKHTRGISASSGNRAVARHVVLATLTLFSLAFAQGTSHAQTLLSETTWGGSGSDVASGVAVAADGSTYVVGSTDSFAVDQFGQPAARNFIVKFAADGSLAWQKVWNGSTAVGGGDPAVAVSADGSVYVGGLSALNGGDALLLKLNPSGVVLWERTWGGAEVENGTAVAADTDCSVYLVGTTTSFGPSLHGLFVLKFDASGVLLWQKFWDGANGDGVGVAPDGSVYVAGTIARPGGLAEFDVLALKLTPGATLLWARTYAAGDVADARGGMAVASDGSLYIAGALQAPKMGFVDIAALMIKLDAGGALVWDKEYGGRGGETGEGVAVAPDGTVYIAGTSTSFGSGFQDAFVVHLLASGKKVLDAVTWGGPQFETGGGVAVAGNGAVSLAATTTVPPPYALLGAPMKLSAPRGTLGVPNGALADAAGTVANPNLGAATTNGSTTYSGNFESALVRFFSQ